jgi:NADH-quinone oxidoreductase subunit N
MIYMAIYVAMSLGVFALILMMRRSAGQVEDIYELAGLARHDRTLGFLLAMLMFSLAGIPPLAGFFAKWYVFVAAVEAKLYGLAVICVILSVVSAFYYLRIVKIIYFDDPAEEFAPRTPSALWVFIAASAVVILLSFAPGRLDATTAASANLLAPAAAAAKAPAH